MLSRIKSQAPLLVVHLRQSLHVSGLRPCSPQKHKNTDISTGPVVVWVETIPLCQGLVFATGHQRSRARICDWTSKVKSSYVRLDIKGPESMPDGMGCHLPMKLRGQNSRSQRKTRSQFSCIPQVAPRHRGNDCQIRWSVSVGSLFISTVASVSSSSDSKALLLLPWLPLGRTPLAASVWSRH